MYARNEISNERYLSHFLQRGVCVWGVVGVGVIVGRGLWYRGRKKLFKSTWHFISFFFHYLALSFFLFYIILTIVNKFRCLSVRIINHCMKIYIKFFTQLFRIKCGFVESQVFFLKYLHKTFLFFPPFKSIFLFFLC